MNAAFVRENDNYTCRVEDATAVFEFKKALFEIATDLKKKQQFFSLLQRIEAAKEIRAILMLNAPGAVEQSEYERFLEQIYEVGSIGQIGLGSETDVLIAREEHAVNQLLKFVSQSTKVTAIGLQGRIMPPFFGIGLAFDFRLVAEDSTFFFSTAGVDIPPSGALCFLLPLYVGLHKATELILRNNRLQTDEALALGLVNAVLPVDDFAQRCRRTLASMVGLSPSVLPSIKALLNAHRREEFERYIEEEFKVIHSAWSDRMRQIRVDCDLADKEVSNLRG